jgi:hypothetical protein
MDADTLFVQSPGQPPVVGYLLRCPACGRKVLVEVALLGTNHNLSVSATCAECLPPLLPGIARRHPDVAARLERWVRGEAGPHGRAE